MATIRNLRNLMLAGIDASHVDKVCSYIKNEKAVVGSRMFPYRFFTAFDILSDLKEFSQQKFAKSKKSKTELKNIKKQSQMCSLQVIEKIENALNEAIIIATKKNIPPMKGKTLILLSIGKEMKSVQMGKKANKSKKVTTVYDMAWLFSLMCNAASEAGEFVAFGHNGVIDSTNNTSGKSLLEAVQNAKNIINDWIRYNLKKEDPLGLIRI